MQVSELESNGLKKSFKIVVAAEEIGKKTETELKEVGKTVKIAGFRAGQVPMKILQQRYGKAVQSDVIEKLVKDSVGNLISEKKFRPAVTPKVDFEGEYKDGGELSFKVALELFPDLPELVFDGITLERKIFDITQNDIDEASARVAERSPQFVELPSDTKAVKGNIVRIDFKGSVDGTPFAGGEAEDFDLELGSGHFIDGFEDQLIGSKAGEEKVVKVTFPAKYPSAQLAGKDAEFLVTVKAVQESKIPEVSDEFAKARGFSDLAAFHEAVRAQIIKEFDQVVRNDLKKQLFDELEKKYDFDLPESMVEAEFNTIWQSIKQAREEGDESLAGKGDAELQDEYKSVAKRRVSLGIILAEIGSRNKIQISREEITQAVMQQASQFPGQEKRIFEFYQKNPNRIEDLRGPILEEKAVDFILSKVKFNEKKLSLDELMKINVEDDGKQEDEEGAEKAEKSGKTKQSASASKTKSKKKDSE